MTNVLLYEKALAFLLQKVNPLPVKLVPLNEAHARIITTNIYAKFDLPRFNNSAMDGYALRYERTLYASENTPVFLSIDKMALAAGDTPTHSTDPNMVHAIMTGAMVPAGYDAVIPVEQIEIINEQIRITQPVTQYKNIRFAGEDLCTDQIIAHTGEQLHAGHIAALASFGYEHIAVRQQPKIKVISVEHDIDQHHITAPSRQYHPNIPYLVSQLKSINIATTVIICSFNQSNTFKTALMESSDDIIVMENVMPNHRQMVLDNLHELGAQVFFYQFAQQSGQSIICARLSDGRYFFDLSNHLESCAIGLHFFIRPLLRALQGLSIEQSITLPLVYSYQKSDTSRHFLQAYVNWQKHHVKILTHQAIDMTANAWVVLTEQQTNVDAQTPVIVVPNHLNTTWI